MAESRQIAATPDLNIKQILLEARHRWLRPAEICEILQNYRKFCIAPEPPNKPPSGSLFLFDKKILRYFRKDGHNWRKKKDGKTVKEAHERLKAGSVDVLHCYYAHGEENENFQRRTYWMLEVDLMHIVLVHYLEVKNGKSSYIRSRDAEENALISPMDSPSCSSSSTNQTHIPLQVTDAGSPSITQTSEYEGAESDNYQAKSRYHSFIEMQQYGNGSVNDIHILNPCAPTPLEQHVHQRLQTTIPASDFYSIAQVALTRDFDETGLGLAPGSITQFGLTSWEEVLEHCGTGLESAPAATFDPTVASMESYSLDNPEQYSLTLGDFFATDVGLGQVANASAQGWQPGNAEIGSAVTSNLDVEAGKSIEGNRAFASLLKQLSLDHSSTERGGLKKYDSFSRWMSNELGDVHDLDLKSASGLYWSTVESESVVDGSNFSNQGQLDSCLVSPSISQEQLFSIVEFSPTWAYTGLETKVLISGAFLKSEDVGKYKWSCMFGEIEVSADILGDGILCCNSPSHKAGTVPFYITCSNRLACSEVREFEYKEHKTEQLETLDFHSNWVNEMNLYIRFEKLLSLGSDPKPVSKIISERQQLISEINSLMLEVDDEWFNMLVPRHKDRLLEKLLKDKLHVWLLYKVAEDGKGPNVLDKEGLGVLHLAAALEYDWAIMPTVTAGVSVNFRDVHGWTALHWAAYCGREQTVATLVGLGANPGALTDPTPEFPSGRTPADLASGNGYKGIAGFLAESSLTRHLFDLTLNDSKNSDLVEASGVTYVKGIVARTDIQPVDGDLSLKDSLSAVRNASQAAARIHQVFRVQSFHRKKLIEYGDDKCRMSDERSLSHLSIKSAKPGQHDLSVHTAATRIQNKFRGWKGRKEFLIIRQRIVKIQAHVRGHQLRRKLGIVWSIRIVEKAIRWRKRGAGLRHLRSEAMVEGCSLRNLALKEDDYDILKEGRKQSEMRLEKALARVKSMVQYPEARDQYRRLLNVVTTLQEPKERAMHDADEVGDVDSMTGLHDLWNDDSILPTM